MTSLADKRRAVILSAWMFPRLILPASQAMTGRTEGDRDQLILRLEPRRVRKAPWGCLKRSPVAVAELTSSSARATLSLSRGLTSHRSSVRGTSF
jgi:hypothetical protein